MKALVLRAHQLEMAVLDRLKSPVLLAIRLVWGTQFFLTGLGKLKNLDNVAQFFASLSIPLPKLNATMAGTTEMVGGLCLLLGLGGRVVTIPLCFTMLVAFATAHRDVFGKMFADKDLDPLISAAPTSFLLASVVILIFGSGAFSADHLLWKKMQEEAPKK